MSSSSIVCHTACSRLPGWLAGFVYQAVVGCARYCAPQCILSKQASILHQLRQLAHCIPLPPLPFTARMLPLLLCIAADSNAPTWWNNLDGQVNLRDAVNRSISLRTPQKEYRCGQLCHTWGPRGRAAGPLLSYRHPAP